MWNIKIVFLFLVENWYSPGRFFCLLLFGLVKDRYSSPGADARFRSHKERSSMSGGSVVSEVGRHGERAVVSWREEMKPSAEGSNPRALLVVVFAACVLGFVGVAGALFVVSMAERKREGNKLRTKRYFNIPVGGGCLKVRQRVGERAIKILVICCCC